MAMSVLAKMHRDGAAVYYSPEWMRTVEAHLTYLRTVSAENIVMLEPQMGVKYQGDFYGLLQHLKVRPEHHWVTLRLNDMTASSQMSVDRTRILLPNFSVLDSLMKVHQTTRKKKIT